MSQRPPSMTSVAVRWWQCWMYPMQEIWTMGGATAISGGRLDSAQLQLDWHAPDPVTCGRYDCTNRQLSPSPSHVCVMPGR